MSTEPQTADQRIAELEAGMRALLDAYVSMLRSEFGTTSNRRPDRKDPVCRAARRLLAPTRAPAHGEQTR